MRRKRRIEPDIEAAIEQTRGFLEAFVGLDRWNADPDASSGDKWAAMREIADSDLSRETKAVAQDALWQQIKKRTSGKPTRSWRDNALCVAAHFLVADGYDLTRNEATRDQESAESAASIIRQALKRISDRKLGEKRLNAILLKHRKLIEDLAVVSVRKKLPTKSA